MHRFFVNANSISRDNIVIDGDDAVHISRVLRLKIGDNITVCNGEEVEYMCSILSIDKKTVTCKIVESRKSASEPPLKIYLYQGMPKSSKMDLIVQKCTELGIFAVIPVFTEHVVFRGDDERDLSGRIIRWQRIAEEAGKQSGRGRIPVIYNPITFEKAVKDMRNMDLSVMPYENEMETGLKQAVNGKNSIRSAFILIGPEGGFSENEVNNAVKNGIITVTLGPRILRTETAGFVCLTILNYALGDMGGRQ
jgi:16S rRNA (uracil1498-N3)-methyltransferase